MKRLLVVFIAIAAIFIGYGCKSGVANNRAPNTFPSELVGRNTEWFSVGNKKVMALTFDAGGDNSGVKSILKTLKETGTPATFFLTGEFVTKFPDEAKKIAQNHRIGNHTVSHPHMTKIGDDKVRSEVANGAEKIRATTGADSRPWFRFPFGESNPKTVAEINRQDFVSIGWTVDSLGWKGRAGGRSANKVTERVLSAARPGGIVLMHVGANPEDHSILDADALPTIIRGLRNRGYSLVDLDQMLSHTKK